MLDGLDLEVISAFVKGSSPSLPYYAVTLNAPICRLGFPIRSMAAIHFASISWACIDSGTHSSSGVDRNKQQTIWGSLTAFSDWQQLWQLKAQQCNPFFSSVTSTTSSQTWVLRLFWLQHKTYSHKRELFVCSDYLYRWKRNILCQRALSTFSNSSEPSRR